jgi:hypothetical protein
MGRISAPFRPRSPWPAASARPSCIPPSAWGRWRGSWPWPAARRGHDRHSTAPSRRAIHARARQLQAALTRWRAVTATWGVAGSRRHGAAGFRGGSSGSALPFPVTAGEQLAAILAQAARAAVTPRDLLPAPGSRPDSAACTAVTATTSTMSSTEHPRDRFVGRPPQALEDGAQGAGGGQPLDELVADVAASRSGTMRTFARPATGLPGAFTGPTRDEGGVELQLAVGGSWGATAARMRPPPPPCANGHGRRCPGREREQRHPRRHAQEGRGAPGGEHRDLASSGGRVGVHPQSAKTSTRRLPSRPRRDHQHERRQARHAVARADPAQRGAQRLAVVERAPATMPSKRPPRPAALPRAGGPATCSRASDSETRGGGPGPGRLADGEVDLGPSAARRDVDRLKIRPRLAARTSETSSRGPRSVMRAMPSRSPAPRPGRSAALSLPAGRCASGLPGRGAPADPGSP